MAYWPSCSLLVRSSCSGLPFPSPSPGTFHCQGTDHDTHFPDSTAARWEGCSFSASPPLAPSPHRTGSVCAPLVYCGWRPQAVCLLMCSPLSLRGRLGVGRTGGAHRKAPWRWGIEARTEVSVLPKLLGMGEGAISGPPPRDTWESVLCFTLFVGDFPFLCAQFLIPLPLSLDPSRKPGEGGDKLGAEIKQTIYSLYVFGQVINSSTLWFPI